MGDRKQNATCVTHWQLKIAPRNGPHYGLHNMDNGNTLKKKIELYLYALQLYTLYTIQCVTYYGLDELPYRVKWL